MTTESLADMTPQTAIKMLFAAVVVTIALAALVAPTAFVGDGRSETT